MKNIISVALLVLATASQATEYATSYAFTDATYTADPGLTLDGVTGEQYQYLFGGSFGNPGTYPVFDATTNAPADPSLYTAQIDGSSTHLHDGNHFAVSATTTSRLSSSVHDIILQTSFGYRYFLDFTNTSQTDAKTVTFEMDFQRSHYGRLTGTPYDGATGEYAESDTYGDAIDLNNEPATVGNNRSSDTIDTSAPTYNGYYAFHDTRTITIAAKTSTRIEVYANAQDSLENVQAVPEPAPLVALGLGAAGILRRRRRA